MADLKDRLIEYGVNFPEVMERFVDDEELYYDCLTAFLSDPSFDELETALDSKDYEAAFNHSHTLKGVAGNLGLAPLYHATCDIVEALRSKEHSNLNVQYENLKVARKPLLELCGTLLEAQKQ